MIVEGIVHTAVQEVAREEVHDRQPENYLEAETEVHTHLESQHENAKEKGLGREIAIPQETGSVRGKGKEKETHIFPVDQETAEREEIESR